MRRTAIGAAVALSVAAVFSGSAIGGDTPLPSRPFPSTAMYHGKAVPSEKAIQASTACNILGGSLSCYDSASQADAAASAAPMVALASCSPPLQVYKDGNFSGRVLNFYDRGYWQNLGSYSFANETSSWDTGCVAGQLADFAGGGGQRIGLGANQFAPSMPAGWNDRADSILRS